MVHEREDGTVVIKHEGHEVPYQLLHKNPHVHQSEVVSNKRLGAVFAAIQEQQKERDAKRLASKTLTLRQKQRIREKQVVASAT